MDHLQSLSQEARLGNRALLGVREVSGDRLSDVLEPVQPLLLELDLAQPAGGALRALADEDLASARGAAQARGDVHRRPVPVALALDGGTGVHADANGGKARELLEPVDDLQPEADGERGILAAD